MHLMYFTERPYRYVSNDEVIKTGFFGIENKHFDSVKGGQLLNEYLDEKILAEDLGFDGVMLNEHHDTAFCMGSVMDVEASILARASSIPIGRTAQQKPWPTCAWPRDAIPTTTPWRHSSASCR